MTNMAGTVAGLSILSGGNIVFNKGENIVIKPFDFDEDFTIKFEYEFNQNATNSRIDFEFPDDKTVSVRWKRKWQTSNRFGLGLNRSFATNIDTRFYLNFAFETIGTEDRYTGILQYTIYSGEK